MQWGNLPLGRDDLHAHGKHRVRGSRLDEGVLDAKRLVQGTHCARRRVQDSQLGVPTRSMKSCKGMARLRKRTTPLGVSMLRCCRPTMTTRSPKRKISSRRTTTSNSMKTVGKGKWQTRMHRLDRDQTTTPSRTKTGKARRSTPPRRKSWRRCQQEWSKTKLVVHQ